MSYFTVYAIVALVILIGIPAIMEVFGDGFDLDSDTASLAILPAASFWPIVIPIAIAIAMLFVLFKLTVFCLRFLKETYKEYKSSQVGN